MLTDPLSAPKPVTAFICGSKRLNQEQLCSTKCSALWCRLGYMFALQSRSCHGPGMSRQRLQRKLVSVAPVVCVKSQKKAQKGSCISESREKYRRKYASLGDNRERKGNKSRQVHPDHAFFILRLLDVSHSLRFDPNYGQSACIWPHGWLMWVFCFAPTLLLG